MMVLGFGSIGLLGFRSRRSARAPSAERIS
jgi:hypothetical protein